MWLIGVILISGIFVLSCWLPYAIIEKKYKEEHAYGKYPCPQCQSLETDGFSTFWYNNGLPLDGDREYNLTHADYSIFRCHHCGNYFHVTKENFWKLSKNTWQNLWNMI